MHRETYREQTHGRRLALAALLVAGAAAAWACGPGREAAQPAAPPAPAAEVNPPAPGFDAAGSDARAIEVADATMAAMGGRQAWDHTRYVAWNFFGFRFHVWDKTTGDIRVEMPGPEGHGSIVVSMNLGTRQGRAWADGLAVTDPAALEEHLKQAYEAWINDSYWLFMPYKLKDSGVTLRYAGEAAMTDGRPSDVLELTFHDVGVTPQNKYRVYVARDSGLVEQWDYYAVASDAEPKFQVPWHGWTRQGAILLSGDRGKRQITEISVHDELPRSVFESPAATGLRQANPPAAQS